MATVAHVALEAQRAWFHTQLGSTAGMDDSSCQVVLAAAPTMKVITWQWDETAQRIQGMLSSLAPGEKLSHSKVATQIMMQAGLISVHSVSEGVLRLESREPWLCRGLMLAEQTADFLLEGLSRRMPVWFDELATSISLCERGPLLVLSLSCDRASQNFKACASPQMVWKTRSVVVFQDRMCRYQRFNDNVL